MLSRILMKMLVAGVQTDTAELVCAVRGHRSIHAHTEKQDQGGGKPLLLPKTERMSLGDVAPCFLSTSRWFHMGVSLLLTAFKPSLSFLILAHFKASKPQGRMFVRSSFLIILSIQMSQKLCQTTGRHTVLTRQSD